VWIGYFASCEFNSPYGGTPKTSNKMMQQDTFENWGFDNIWYISENEDYPSLRTHAHINNEE